MAGRSTPRASTLDLDPRQKYPWDRLRGETSEWYSRFFIYLQLGPKRTMSEAYRIWRATVNPDASELINPAWTENAKAWQWADRAAAWDDEHRRIALAEEEQIQQEEREHRRKMLRDSRQLMGNRLTAMMKSEDKSLEKMSAGQFFVVMIALMRAQREEYGEDKTRLEISGPNGKELGIGDVPEPDPSRLSFEELEQFEVLWRKLHGLDEPQVNEPIEVESRVVVPGLEYHNDEEE